MGGIWKHRRTGNLYLVLGLAGDANNSSLRWTEPQVVYVSLHWHPDFGARVNDGPPMHFRSLEEFLERFDPTGEVA